MSADAKAAYLDSSAIVKLVIEEEESIALRRYLRRRRPLQSSAIARTEVLRAVLQQDDAATQRVHEALAKIDLLRVNDRVLNAAGALRPWAIRSLDAIHVATALEVREDIAVVVTYDDRMKEAAMSVGFRVVAPS